MPMRTAVAVRAVSTTLAALAMLAPVGHAQLPAPQFAQKPLPAPQWGALDIGDVNGDGLLDVVLLDQPVIRVYLGLGAGQFAAPPVESPFELDFYSRNLADVTGDGRADSLSVDGIWLLHVKRGNADGTFTPLGTYTVIYEPNEPVAADMNHDGLRDIVVSSGDWWAGGLSVLLADGHGGFHDPLEFESSPALDVPYPLDTADADCDGHVDVLVSDSHGHRLVLVRGTGDGGFQPPLTITTSSAGPAADFADLDVDGLPDVVSANSSHLLVNMNLGAGSFGPTISSNANPGLWDYLNHVEFGELNGDGLPDAVYETKWGQLRINLGRGDGSFDDPITVNLIGLVDEVRVADVDRNGSDDLVVSHYSAPFVSVLLNQRPAWPWKLVGTGLAGSHGVPALHGSGTLVPGEPITLSLTRALPGALALLVVGTTQLAAPCKGGVIVPFPSAVLLWPTDGNGEASITDIVPADVPPHSQLWLQAWIADAGPQGLAATNGVCGTVP